MKNSVNHTYGRSGYYTATLKVRDDDGEESQEPDEVSLRVQGPPYAVLTASPTSISFGETVTFDASDSTDDSLNLEYFFDFGDDEDSGWITSATTTHAYNKGGSFTASLVVRDGQSRESENSALVDIQVIKPPNLAPIAFIDTISPNPSTLGTTVQFSGHGQDDDGTVTDYEWSSSLDGFLSTDPVFSTSELSAGDHTISFKVKDNLGDWSDEAFRELTVKLENILPALEIISPSDFEEVSGEVVISGLAEDDDGAVVRVEVRMDEGSWEVAQGTTAWSYTLNTSELAQGEHTISVRAFDGEEYSEITAISILVSEPGEGDDNGEFNTLFIIAVVMACAGIVLILAAAIGKYIKKENAQMPAEPVEYIEPAEPPPARMNW
jgi:PKD repeat protein